MTSFWIYVAYFHVLTSHITVFTHNLVTHLDWIALSLSPHDLSSSFITYWFPITSILSLGKSVFLTQLIQMQLSRKLKISSRFFSKFAKSTSHFELFGKKDEPHSWFISAVIDCKKAWLLKCLKSPVSEYLWRVNMLKGPKHC